MTTAASGLHSGGAKGIDFIKLKELEGRGTVIYDLRKANDPAQLQALFPQAEVRTDRPRKLLQAVRTRCLAAAKSLLRESAAAIGDLVVLIDDDGTTAEATAQRMRASGMEQVVVLNGGDLMVELEGRTGLERRGVGSISLDGDPLNTLEQE